MLSRKRGAHAVDQKYKEKERTNEKNNKEQKLGSKKLKQKGDSFSCLPNRQIGSESGKQANQTRVDTNPIADVVQHVWRFALCAKCKKIWSGVAAKLIEESTIRETHKTPDNNGQP
ncbi:unnamed protein product [Ceratitis capitata]|uniref:(Mediterranean fruit fly) hypothetical protein n=1 Tax=Ceratitis capitata TaxID=7213 RepID=A0A811ULU3_CERCA|nr:unnamed protein product [Ceratitis capitata]